MTAREGAREPGPPQGDAGGEGVDAVSEQPAKWKSRRDSAYSREKCSVCGYLSVNVRHEGDPENAPEGPDYYRENVPNRHPFVPSGKFER